jgi:hypothetical protein
MELVKNDMKASHESLQEYIEKLRTVEENKSINVATVTADLLQCDKQNAILKEKITNLEQRIMEQSETLRHSDEDRMALRLELATFKERYRNISASRPSTAEGCTTPSHATALGSPSATERDIAKKLEITRNELRKYDGLVFKKVYSKNISPGSDRAPSQSLIPSQEEDFRSRSDERGEKMTSTDSTPSQPSQEPKTPLPFGSPKTPFSALAESSDDAHAQGTMNHLIRSFIKFYTPLKIDIEIRVFKLNR